MDFSQILKVPVCKLPVCELLRCRKTVGQTDELLRTRAELSVLGTLDVPRKDSQDWFCNYVDRRHLLATDLRKCCAGGGEAYQKRCSMLVLDGNGGGVYFPLAANTKIATKLLQLILEPLPLRPRLSVKLAVASAKRTTWITKLLFTILFQSFLCRAWVLSHRGGFLASRARPQGFLNHF